MVNRNLLSSKLVELADRVNRIRPLGPRFVQYDGIAQQLIKKRDARIGERNDVRLEAARLAELGANLQQVR